MVSARLERTFGKVDGAGPGLGPGAITIDQIGNVGFATLISSVGNISDTACIFSSTGCDLRGVIGCFGAGKGGIAV